MSSETRSLTHARAILPSVGRLKTRLGSRSRSVRALDQRLRTLQLFDADPDALTDDPEAAAGSARSRRHEGDHPLVQLLLQNRDDYLAMRQTAARLEDAILDVAQAQSSDPLVRLRAAEALASASRALATVIGRGQACLESARACVQVGMHAIAAQTAEEVKLMTAAAKMTQTQLQHEERMAAIDENAAPPPEVAFPRFSAGAIMQERKRRAALAEERKQLNRQEPTATGS